MFLAASVISWVMTIAPIGPGTAPDIKPETRFYATQDECAAAGQKFMVDHQFINWQGHKMNQLIRVKCERIDEE